MVEPRAAQLDESRQHDSAERRLLLRLAEAGVRSLSGGALGRRPEQARQWCPPIRSQRGTKQDGLGRLVSWRRVSSRPPGEEGVHRIRRVGSHPRLDGENMRHSHARGGFLAATIASLLAVEALGASSGAARGEQRQAAAAATKLTCHNPPCVAAFLWRIDYSGSATLVREESVPGQREIHQQIDTSWSLPSRLSAGGGPFPAMFIPRNGRPLPAWWTKPSPTAGVRRPAQRRAAHHGDLSERNRQLHLHRAGAGERWPADPSHHTTHPGGWRGRLRGGLHGAGTGAAALAAPDHVLTSGHHGRPARDGPQSRRCVRSIAASGARHLAASHSRPAPKQRLHPFGNRDHDTRDVLRGGHGVHAVAAVGGEAAVAPLCGLPRTAGPRPGRVQPLSQLSAARSSGSRMEASGAAIRRSRIRKRQPDRSETLQRPGSDPHPPASALP
jgi:hypothetical protein